MQWVDQGAGGSDHSAQAHVEHHEMDMAVCEHGTADHYASAANAYAAEGDLDHAAQHDGQAAAHQDPADTLGDCGEHSGDMAVDDASSDMAHQDDGAYDGTGYHDSSYDAGYYTSYDASASSNDTAPPTPRRS